MAFPKYFIILGCTIIVACLGHKEEKLKKEIQQGIWKLHYDLENGWQQDNILGYFPTEIEELIPQIRKYFMGKEEGYSTTQVLTHTHIFYK